jgi:hypothetical protein
LSLLIKSQNSDLKHNRQLQKRRTLPPTTKGDSGTFYELQLKINRFDFKTGDPNVTFENNVVVMGESILIWFFLPPRHEGTKEPLHVLSVHSPACSAIE